MKYQSYETGQWIKTARRACGMPKDDAAEQLDVSVSHDRAIENGTHAMSLQLAICIAALHRNMTR